MTGDGEEPPLLSPTAISTPQTMRSVFANCGQVCLGTGARSRRAYTERFVGALKQGAENLKLGRPEDVAANKGRLSASNKRAVLLQARCRRRRDRRRTGAGIAGELAGSWVNPRSGQVY